MEISSGEEDDFPTHEYITPQSNINSVYQSDTEKGIRKLCSELLDLKDAVENLSGNAQSKFVAFLRISEEVAEVQQELLELQRHVSSQGFLVQDLKNGVCQELEIWKNSNTEDVNINEDLQLPEIDKLLNEELEDKNVRFLETMDILLAEHRIEEALSAIDEEEQLCPELKDLEENPFKIAFLERKEMIVDQLVAISKQPSISVAELKKALSSLVKLGKSSLAHQLLLEAYDTRLRKDVEAFLPFCSVYLETHGAKLSQLVFSTISAAAKESSTLFGDSPNYTNNITQWAENEIDSYVQLVKKHSPSPDTGYALRSASVCIQASLSHCTFLESQGLKFAELLLVLLSPYVEEILDLSFRGARKEVSDLARNDDIEFHGSPSSLSAPSITIFMNSGKKFMSIVKDMLEPLTPAVILHFGGTILSRLLQLFDKYIEKLINALPGSPDDANNVDPKIILRAETDAEQLALIGTAYMVADELLPMAVSKIFAAQNGNKDDYFGSPDSMNPVTSTEYKEWRRHLQHSLDKLRDYFCRQYVVTFIYSREGKARLDAHMYLEVKGEDLIWDSDPLPSLPFQALFARLQQVESILGDVLLGKEKIQKILLSRLTEVVVMWLSEEEEFWEVLTDELVELQPSGLQQLILDMYFILEIAICGGYPSKYAHQLVSAIITRAIQIFSHRGIDPQSALPEDEWFVDTAKLAVNKLLLRSPGSESSELEEHDDEHIIIQDDSSDSDQSPISPFSSGHSIDSFASATMDDIDGSPVYFTDTEA